MNATPENKFTVVMLKEPSLIIMEGIPSKDDPGTIGEYVAVKGAPIARNPLDAQTALQTACNNHPGHYFFIALCSAGMVLPVELIPPKTNGPDVV